MSQSEIANKVNKLVDLLMEVCDMDMDTIKETLDLTYYEVAFLGLSWMYDED